jgi:seryl-tRNA synthetase
MFDPRWVREHADEFDRGLARRGLPSESKKVIALDEKRRAVIAKLQGLQERRNAASKEIGEAKKAKDEKRASALMAEVAKIKDDFPRLETEQAAVEKELNDALAQIPNLPAADVPDGTDPAANEERHAHGKKPSLNSSKQHFELGEALGLMDFELAAKLSGSRFVVLKGALAHMERSISQFFLDVHTNEFGYLEIAPPLLVRDGAMWGTGQLPKFYLDQFFSYGGPSFEEAMKKFADRTRTNAFEDVRRLGLEKAEALVGQELMVGPEKSRHWLIPTAEVPLTNFVRESIVDEAELPLRFTACTPCFRAEAGAAGKDTRGMLRQHQFTKVELVSITTPAQSKDEHERMLSCAEEVLKRLGLHYRVMTLCTGDMGFAAQKTYDIEVWLPGQGTYREISSCSNCGEFQARRMEARWRSKDGKVAGPVHTLNGSGVAVGRALIAVMENYQDENGAIAVPDVLQPYMGGLKKIEKKK